MQDGKDIMHSCAHSESNTCSPEKTALLNMLRYFVVTLTEETKDWFGFQVFFSLKAGLAALWYITLNIILLWSCGSNVIVLYIIK